VYSLEGDVAEWFSDQDPNKFSTLAEIFKLLEKGGVIRKRTDFY
jgi:hypothetical protein